jgi:hypothetical protein
MSFSLPPAVKLAERLRLEIEQAVRRFPRYHKYTTGTDLRSCAKRVVLLAHRGWRKAAAETKSAEKPVRNIADRSKAKKRHEEVRE